MKNWQKLEEDALSVRKKISLLLYYTLFAMHVVTVVIYWLFTTSVWYKGKTILQTNGRELVLYEKWFSFHEKQLEIGS